MPDEAKTRGRPTDEDKRAVWQAQMGSDPATLIRASVEVALRAASGRASTGGASSTDAPPDTDDIDLRAAGAGGSGAVAATGAPPVCSSTAAWAGVAAAADIGPWFAVAATASSAAAPPYAPPPAAAATFGAPQTPADEVVVSPRRSERQPQAGKPPLLRGIELLASVAWHLEHSGSS